MNRHGGQLNKYEILRRIVACKLVAVLRGDSAAQVERFADHAIAGGIKVVEITMTVPGALSCIERLTERYAGDDNVVIGAGSVLDAQTARLAILAGAAFVVTPMFSEAVTRLCNRYAVPNMPGAYTVAEVIAALEGGVDIIKLFPGDIAGPKMIRAIKGPIPQANLMPTGGVNLENLTEWLAAGAVAVGIGSDLTKAAVETGDFEQITKRARAYVEIVCNG